MQKLKSIEMLRGAAALLVVLFHTQSIAGAQAATLPFGGLFSGGCRGVDLFFVLSGFIISHVHAGDLGRPARLPAYLYNRITRIYPAVWIISFVALALYVAGYGGAAKAGKLATTGIIASFLLLAQWGDALVNVTWTLKYEVFFYALFATLIIDRRLGITLLLLWQAGALALSAMFPIDRFGIAGFYGTSLCLEFGIGMACAWAVRLAASQRLLQAPALLWPLLLAGIVLFLSGMTREPMREGAMAARGAVALHAWSIGIRSALGASCLIVSLVLLERSGRIRVPDCLVRLGRASYAIYLVHYSVVTLLAGALVRHLVPMTDAVCLAVACVAILTGWMFHRFIDQPIQNLLRGRPSKARALPWTRRGLVPRPHSLTHIKRMGGRGLQAPAGPGRSPGLAPDPRHAVERLSSPGTLVTSILWNGFGRVLPILVAVLTTPFLLHRLGVDRWALFTLALSVAGSFSIFDFGVSAALTRALAERVGTARETEAAPLILGSLLVLLASSVLGAGAGYAFTPAIVDRLLNVPPGLRAETIEAFRMLTLAGPLIIVNATLWGVMSAYQQFRAATLLNIPVNLLYYVGPMLALLLRDSLVAVIAAIVLTRLLQAVLCGMLAVRLVPDLARRPRLQPRLLLGLLRIGVWVTVSNTLWPVMLYLDRFIVGAMLSLAAVSFYATPLDLVMRLMLVPMTVAAAMFPAVATSHHQRPERAGALLRIGSLATMAAVFPACLIAAGCARDLLTLWLGHDFAAGSFTVLMILGVGMFLNCAAILPGTLADAIGRPDIGAIILAVQVVLFPPVVVLCASRYGVEGAALAWTLRAAANCAARLLVCGRLRTSAAGVVPALAAVILLATLTLAVFPVLGPLLGPPALRYAVMAAAGIAVPHLFLNKPLAPDGIPDMGSALTSGVCQAAVNVLVGAQEVINAKGACDRAEQKAQGGAPHAPERRQVRGVEHVLRGKIPGIPG